ncbi:uncharacterized protein Triagg1_7782 [Trichoderma aggressivum f. europaeum]|uniref:Uncharacterized protein n=1 Tax=Trichoderma aggressivum f. europaeum TaxID=173218 RepID=A0AAE1I9C8_9HYPO|nr:hypothetical protein Triagg1_7782 [Trichoderma aggressivum f. europaeum]
MYPKSTIIMACAAALAALAGASGPQHVNLANGQLYPAEQIIDMQDGNLNAIVRNLVDFGSGPTAAGAAGVSRLLAQAGFNAVEESVIVDDRREIETSATVQTSGLNYHIDVTVEADPGSTSNISVTVGFWWTRFAEETMVNLIENAILGMRPGQATEAVFILVDDDSHTFMGFDVKISRTIP